MHYGGFPRPLKDSTLSSKEIDFDDPLQFGNASDGDFNSAGNVVFNVPSGLDDTDNIVKQYNNFTLNAGHTLTIDNRNKGLIIICQGDCTINGTIDQSGKAPLIEKVSADNISKALLNVDSTSKKLSINALGNFPSGGAGGLNNGGGDGMSNPLFGGGKGGKGRGGYDGGLGGGIVILIVRKNLTITGIINCTGKPGTNMNQYGETPGSGGGGGVIMLIHKGIYTLTGTLNINGGAGGVNNQGGTGYPGVGGSIVRYALT